MDVEYFTIPEVAEKLKVTRAAVNKWISQGKIDVVYVGSDRRITGAAIEAFVQASTKARKSRLVDGGATIEEAKQSPSHVAALQLA
jgi:excisionase family DNA binding protein